MRVRQAPLPLSGRACHARRMEEKSKHPPQPAADPAPPTGQPAQPSQQDLMHKGLPKKKVAKALEEFDGDEA